jgi:hypothetical protein
MNAMSGVCVAEDREVVRREVPRDADVGLMQAEVHTARRDEVDLAELLRRDQVADHVHRRAVEERVAGHQHEPAVGGDCDQVTRRVARRGERLLDEDVLVVLQRE